jgi:hypothetical protein
MPRRAIGLRVGWAGDNERDTTAMGDRRMKAKNMVLLMALTAGVTLTATVLWGQLTTQEVRKMAIDLRPYQVVAGQVAASTFEVVYVLDNVSRRLAILEYDSTTNKLLPMAGRDLTKDFNSTESGGYSMITTQLSNQQGLLYVTDFGSHRAIAYRVDTLNNRVTPQNPVDLKALFGD